MRLFMDISAVYIRKLMEYRKLVSRKIKANQTADLLKTINSYKLAEEEATSSTLVSTAPSRSCILVLLTN